MNIQNLLVGGAMAIVTLAATTAASAATFLYTVADTSGTILSGQFTTDNAGDVLTLTGTLSGGALPFTPTGPVTLVANPNFPGVTTSPGAGAGGFNYDNAYDGSTGNNILTGFDNNGLLFTVGGIEYNLFSNGANPYQLYNDTGVYNFENVMFSVTAVPEAATWTMMILGIGLLGAGLRLGSGKPERAIA